MLLAEIWPQPFSSSYGVLQASIDPSTFSINAIASIPLLQHAIDKYKRLIFPLPGFAKANSTSTILQLNVFVEDLKTPLPQLDINSDESYTISVDGEKKTADLKASTVWGAIRGLESFLQLIDFAPSTQAYSIQYPTMIDDKPRFAWRGLLIDSARHYLPKAAILHTIDAMAYNKFNVLHWHLVDAESFPLVIEEVPDIAAKGAFHPKAIYRPEDVKEIVEYGYKSGVRVVPEIDTPGHSYSWRFADSTTQIVSQCPAAYSANINNFPLDPSKERTYEVIQEVWKQIGKLFPDEFVHIGGDEVAYICWTGNPEVSAWMAANGYKTGPEVFQYFMNRMFDLIPKTVENKRILIWEDVFNANLTLPKDVLVEIWSGASTLGKVLQAGFQAVNAYGWYLDKQTPYDAAPAHYEMIDTWKDFYNYEPTANITGDLSLLLGGEGAMWGEQVDETTIDERLWPRASAIAERLWSQQSVSNVDAAKVRLIKYRCSLARRGVRAGPVAPDYCPLEMDPIR